MSLCRGSTVPCIKQSVFGCMARHGYWTLYRVLSPRNTITTPNEPQLFISRGSQPWLQHSHVAVLQQVPWCFNMFQHVSTSQLYQIILKQSKTYKFCWTSRSCLGLLYLERRGSVFYRLDTIFGGLVIAGLGGLVQYNIDHGWECLGWAWSCLGWY